MLTRIAAIAAVGATVFGLAGAGASMLTTGGTQAVVQQSDSLTATCENPNTIAFDHVVVKDDVTEMRLFQQSIEPQCSGDFIQVALKMDNGAVVYSNKVWIPTSNVTSPSQESFLVGSTDLSQYGYAVYGEDLYPQFPAGVCATHVESTVLTIAGQINSLGTNTAGAVDGTLPTCENDNFFTNSSVGPA